MEFKFNFDELYDRIRLHLMVELHVVDEKLLRYVFVESHPDYREPNGMPYIDVLYKSADRRGNSLTPIRINEKKPSLTVLNDSDFSKANLYYGDLSDKKNKGLDAVFSFIFHSEKLFSKRTESIKGKEAGEFFREINKLAVLDNKEKFFVYVFDFSMKDYYERLMGGHESYRFLAIQEGALGERVVVESKEFDAWASRNDTPGYNYFQQKAFSLFRKYRFAEFDYQVEILYSNTLINGADKKYYLIIGQVK